MTTQKEAFSGADFTISRIFEAPRELVFQTWTDPKHIARWWGPRIVTCPVCEMDAKPAGIYRITMRMPDGIEFPVTGEVLSVKAPEKLVMTMDCTEHPPEWHDMVNPNRGKNANPAGIMVMTATFDELGGRTKLTVSIRSESAAIRDAMLKMGMTEGWSQSLDRLDENLNSDALRNTEIGQREVITTRIVDAPRELVWEAWTDPEKIAKWWGPDGFTNTIHVMDVRPGGKWSYVMHGPDGTDYQNESVFVELVKPERLVFDHTCAPFFRFIVAFDDMGNNRTRVTMHQHFNTSESREKFVKMPGVVIGAKQTMDRMADSFIKP